MFGVLPESRSVRQFRIGGSFVSVAAHALLVGGLVALTASASEPEDIASTERIAPLAVAPPPPPPAQQAPRVASASAVPATFGTPGLIAPIDIPLDLPDIDLSTRAVVPDEIVGSTPRGIITGVHTGAHSRGMAILAEHAYSADQVEKPVVMRTGSPTPAYPELLRRAGVTGMVIVEFVVDTTGRVDPASVLVRSSDHEQFSSSVRAVVPKLRFLPAELQGRKVAQLVQLPFRFDVTP